MSSDIDIDCVRKCCTSLMFDQLPLMTLQNFIQHCCIVLYKWVFYHRQHSCCTVVMAIQKSIGKWEFLPPVEPKLLRILCWMAHVIMSRTSPHMQILGKIGSPGGFPQIREIWHFCDFFECPYFLLDPLHRSNRGTGAHALVQMTCFRTWRCLLGVRMKGDAVWGKCAPKNPKRAWIGNFEPNWQDGKIATSQWH